jgi:ABC-2 type transport system ATP-binding protein
VAVLRTLAWSLGTMNDVPVEARGLVKRYGEIAAVDGVDLTVRPGEIYGFLGPNGPVPKDSLLRGVTRCFRGSRSSR